MKIKKFGIESKDPELKLSQHPSGIVIAFEDRRHIYYIDEKNGPAMQDIFGTSHPIYRKVKSCNGNFSFTSGTTFIHKFFQEFDKERISAAYAKKHGLNQQDVLDDWAKRGKDAREDGTATHDFAEHYILGHDPVMVAPDENQRVHNMQRTVLKAIEYLQRSYEFIEPEMVIASPELGVAGMLDLMAVNKKTGTKVIFDWKTNRQIKTENIWQSGYRPISHLQDTNFNHYNLQLNLYEYLGKNDGYFQKSERIDKTLIHITEDDFCLMPCFDMQKEIKNMLAA